MSRPIIKLQPEPIDRIFDVLSLLFLVLLIGLPAYHYSALPDIIPIHFNFLGDADNTGHKAWIWVLPVLGFILLMTLRWTINAPHKFNYPTPVTEENAPTLYRNASRSLRLVQTTMMAIFTYLVYATIMIAYEQQEGLNAWIILGLILITVVGSIYLSYASKK